jgi:hypothetical protein
MKPRNAIQRFIGYQCRTHAVAIVSATAYEAIAIFPGGAASADADREIGANRRQSA